MPGRTKSSLTSRASALLVTDWLDPGQNVDMPGPSLHELLVRELKVIRKRGLHRLRDYLDDLPALCELAERTSGARTPQHVEGLLRDAWRLRAEGAQGTAVGLLLGLEQGRRGASPTVLRKVAADRLGYHSVDTFRKQPEANAIAYFADVIESYCIDIYNQPRRDDERIEAAIRAIEQLNAKEYGELIRRLRARYVWFNTEPEKGDFRDGSA
jgi:hypothetical protein